MINKIKNIIISFFIAYLIIDLFGVYFLTKSNPSCVKLFFGNFKDPKHISILIVSLIISFIVYYLLEKNDENIENWIFYFFLTDLFYWVKLKIEEVFGRGDMDQATNHISYKWCLYSVNI